MIAFFKGAYHFLKSWTLHFIQNQDTLKAAALSFYSFTSIVPIMAVFFGIASGFGYEKFLEEQLKEAFSGQEEVIQYVIQFSRSMLANTKSSVIAGVGFIMLIWTAFSILGNVEISLNSILKIPESRRWYRQLSDYLFLMIVCAVVFIATSSLNVYLVTQLHDTSEQIHLVKVISPYLVYMLKIIPLLLSVLLFIIIYVFIPSSWFLLAPRIIAGIITGVVFQFWQWAYIIFQGQISSYGAIYGTFAALPLFLLWLQVSWLILLGGAEIAAYLENKVTYESGTAPLDSAPPEYVGLLIVYLCVHAYHKDKPPPTVMDLSRKLGISPQITKQLADILTASEILVEIKHEDTGDIGCRPGRDIHLIHIKDVCDAINKKVSWTTTMYLNPTLFKILNYLEAFDENLKSSESNITLAQLAEIEPYKV